jgi:glucose/arabinose dehydrogenase
MRKSWIGCVLVAVGLAVAIPGNIADAATSPANLPLAHPRIVQIAAGLTKPIALAWRVGDGGRVYVAEQTGHVRIVAQGHIVATALTLTVSLDSNERGLLGLAFSRNGTKMYVDYTIANGDILIAEYTMNGNVANLASRRLLLQIPHRANANHNGGNLVVGADNFLYISTGDGGGAGDPLGNGQKLGSRLGKILRIDPRPSAGRPYTIPPSNPFVNRAGARPEIYMWGLRNPWRFSLDRVNRDMWIGDVGQAAFEEIDYAAAGQSGINWGWNRREGFQPYNGGTQPPGARDPLLVRDHTAGDCAIIGGYVYRGNSIPNFYGAYVFGDECTGQLRAVVQQGGSVTQSKDLGLNIAQVTTFGEGLGGELYAASRTGKIYALVP